MTEPFAGDGGLAEGDAAVVGGDFAMGKDFKAIVAQGFEAAGEQKRVLEAAAAEAYTVELELGAHAAATRKNDGDHSAVKAGCDAGVQLAAFNAGDDPADHGTKVDFDR